MPNVTQTRKYLSPQTLVSRVGTAPPLLQNATDVYPSPTLASQTTTSFRTGGALDELSSDKDFGSNYREFHNTLREDYRTGPQSEYDNGHEFDTVVQWVEGDEMTLVSADPVASRVTYTGPIFSDRAYHQRSTYPGTPALQSLGYYGPAAIKRAAPTSPHVSLAQALSELKREGIPAIPGFNLLKDRVAHFRELGGEYLNLEFGWKPIISDVQATASAVRDSARILRQYQRDSGKLVRRRERFTPITDTWVREQPAVGKLLRPPGFNASNWSNMFVGGLTTGSLFESEHSITNTWFSGAFTYYLQSDNSILNRAYEFEQKANLLLGTRITPDVLWNLAPWSWLSDWFVNIGDNISNATSLTSDGLVMKYGYLMQETVSVHTCTVVGPTLKRTNVNSFTTRFYTRRKHRMKATPYGFGSNPASFTNRQWAILSALGFARGTGQLSHGD
jgi:hypothetical protein